jgi:predicted DNA binding CopG/RHH family protein
MSASRLTKEEKAVLRSVERRDWRSTRGVKDKIQQYRGFARATVRKDKRVNIRMSEKDLVRFQKKAMQEGLPYQTLISSVLHKYINGSLADKTG